MTATVLVTGSGGFVGRGLVPRLARAGWLVRAAARNTAAIPVAARISPVAMGDLAQAFDWSPLLAGVSHVVHLAGIAHDDGRTPESLHIEVNANAVRRLALAAREAGVERVLLVSSIRAQSGASAPAILDEQVPPQLTSGYGRSKLLGEQGLAEALAGSDTEWVVLRPVLLYGPGVKGNMHWLERLARSPLPLPFGALPGRRSLLGLPSFASAVMHGLESPLTPRLTFLVAEPGPLTTPEIIAALRRGLSRPPGMFNLPLAVIRSAVRLAGLSAAWERVSGNLIADAGRLERTGWRPAETAAEGLARWMREGAAAQP